MSSPRAEKRLQQPILQPTASSQPPHQTAQRLESPQPCPLPALTSYPCIPLLFPRPPAIGLLNIGDWGSEAQEIHHGHPQLCCRPPRVRYSRSTAQNLSQELISGDKIKTATNCYFPLRSWFKIIDIWFLFFFFIERNSCVVSYRCLSIRDLELMFFFPWS